MGANASSTEDEQLLEIANSEFQTAHKSKDFLTLGEILKYTPPDDFKVDLHHLPTLYSIDSNKDGRFCLQDIQSFARKYKVKSKQFQTYELLSQIKGSFAIDMGIDIKKNGVDDFVAWIGRLLLQGCTSIPISIRRH